MPPQTFILQLHGNPDGHLARTLLAVALHQNGDDAGLTVSGWLSGQKLPARVTNHPRRCRSTITGNEDKVVKRKGTVRLHTGQTGYAGSQYCDDRQSRHSYLFHSTDDRIQMQSM
jgi:hypothetical protein